MIALPKTCRSLAYCTASSYAARDSDRLGGDANTPTFKVRKSNPVTLPLLPQQTGSWERHVLEGNLTGVRRMLAHFRFDTDHLVSWRAGRDDERRYPFWSKLGLCFGKNKHNVRVPAGCDKVLHAAEHVQVALAD